MRHSLYWSAAVLIAGGAIGLAGKPAPAAAAEPVAADPAAAQAALTASEDVALLKVIASLGLTRAQLTTLLPALEGAQAKLAEQDAKEAARLAAWKGSLDQARRDLLAGTGSGSRAVEQFGLAQWTAAQNRARLRADMVSNLRAALEKILTPEQTTQMAASGQAALMAQRMAGWQGGGGGFPGGWGGPGGRGGFGGPGGGPGGGGPGGGGAGGGGPSGRLDQIRQMSPAEFQDFSQRQAGRMGGPDSPRFQQYVSSMNQMRDMPQGQYLLQRDQLAAQQFGRRGFGPGGATDDDAIRAFVEQYLLSPRAPIVLRDRLQAQ